MLAAASLASWAFRRMSVPGVVGTLFCFIRRRAASLSPMLEMTSAGGPMNTTPLLLAQGGEPGVFREEAIARVDGLGVGGQGRADNALAV